MMTPAKCKLIEWLSIVSEDESAEAAILENAISCWRLNENEEELARSAIAHMREAARELSYLLQLLRSKCKP